MTSIIAYAANAMREYCYKASVDAGWYINPDTGEPQTMEIRRMVTIFIRNK